MDYVFTQDWTAHFRESAEKLFLPMAGRVLSYLEIGVYEGRSACWMLDNVLTHPDSRLLGVDVNMQSNCWKNLERHTPKVMLYEGDSKVVVPRLNQRFDIIYIDGDHSAKGCLFDSVAAWQTAKQDCIVLWDDYVSRDKSNRVHKAVQAFLSCVRKKEYRVLLEGEQFAVQKRL